MNQSANKRTAAQFFNRVRVGLNWRFESLKRLALRSFGVSETQWARVVMDREIASFIHQLPRANLSALEVSGCKWRSVGFGDYESVNYPNYDICAEPYRVAQFDVVILEQVLEHVLWPYRAVRNAHSMLKNGGVLIVSTPFLLRVHDCPVDCCRWTELGMCQLMAECGFDSGLIRTGSWGNRACVRANFRRWVPWISWYHSLRNEPEFPVVIWAFARKSAG